MILDELAPWLDLIAHQGDKKIIGSLGIFNPDLQQGAVGRVHGRFPELFRVHLAQTFIPLQVTAPEGLLADDTNQLAPIFGRNFLLLTRGRILAEGETAADMLPDFRIEIKTEPVFGNQGNMRADDRAGRAAVAGPGQGDQPGQRGSPLAG